MIWRYDPILFTETYSEDYHSNAFREIASSLNGYCTKVVISFIDLYAKTKKNMKDIHMIDKEPQDLYSFSARLSEIAKTNNMEIETCAELIDLTSCGIKHGSCINQKLIEKIIGCSIHVSRDKNQRTECGCVESVDIGAYNTCLSGCKYCYANYNHERVKEWSSLYDENAPILCSEITEEDKIKDKSKDKSIKSLKEGQLSIFDLMQ